MIHLKEKYNTEAVPKMMKKFGYSNIMAVPKIEKVVLNVGIGKILQGKSPKEKQAVYEPMMNILAQISGQKPVLINSKRSIASFKLREGQPVGLKITLRGRRMEDFLERLIHIALPRTRDFEGIGLKSFDRGGSLTVAIREYISFPEILAEREEKIFSFEAAIATTAKTKEEGIELLKLLGFPIKSEDNA